MQMDGIILKDDYSLSPVDSEPFMENQNPPKLEQDFEGHPSDIRNRNSKSKTTQLTKSTLHLAVRTHTQTIATRSDAFPTNLEHNTVLCKYTISWSNKKENNKIYKIMIELPQIETVVEAIRDVIPYFNQKLAEDRSQYILSTDPNLYDFSKAKKNGLPKADYPVFDSNQVLSQTSIQNIALIEREPSAVIQKEDSNNAPEKGNLLTAATMVSTTMPLVRNGQGYQTIAEEDYIEETKCFCFKRIVKRKNKETDNDLNTKLLNDIQ